MTLFINNEVVAKVLTMPDTIAALEKSYRALADQDAVCRPRIDIQIPTKDPKKIYQWGTMEGGSTGGYFAIRMKSDVIYEQEYNGAVTQEKYCVRPDRWCGLIFLTSTENAEPLALINDGVLQHMRVGADGGIGVKYMSREDSAVVGMLGSGGMARTFLEAYCIVRPIKRVKVYSRNPENRRRYADDMSRRLNIEVTAVDSPREAARGVDILSTCTDSIVPTIEAAWLEPGMHVVNLGPHEISAEVAAHFDVKVQQGLEGLPLPESNGFRKGIGGSLGAFVMGSEEQQKRLPRATRNLKLGEWPVYTDVLSGAKPGRTRADQITHYRTIGNWGVQFSSVGGLVYRKAKAAGLGRELPTEWFLQDIRN